MAAKVDLYNSAYGSYEADVYRRIRTATYGQDFGQTSWVTTEESHKIPRLLDLSSTSSVLKIGSGSGRYALHLAETTRCRILGLDVNELGVENANRLSVEAGFSDHARFQTCDVSKPLPFEDAGLDAAFSNDVICHIPGGSHCCASCFAFLSLEESCCSAMRWSSGARSRTRRLRHAVLSGTTFSVLLERMSTC